MKEKILTLTLEDEQPLRWPDGWPRTLINDREFRAAWKKTMPEYRRAVGEELQKMGATSVVISRNIGDKERLDPGVAVWFSLSAQTNTDWQVGLHLDNPAPTLDEIDSAYKALALKHHPDRGGDVEIFKKIGEYRKRARAWVLGERTAKLENCIPMDQFKEVRLNLAAVKKALACFRGLEQLGIPAILQRVMSTTFKTALTAGASSIEEKHEPVTA